MVALARKAPADVSRRQTRAPGLLHGVAGAAHATEHLVVIQRFMATTGGV